MAFYFKRTPSILNFHSAEVPKLTIHQIAPIIFYREAGMKKLIIFAGLTALIVWTTCCAPTATVTSGGGPDIAEAQAERYDGPKARLAVGNFEDKTASGSISSYWMGNYGIAWKQIGDGMRNMLTTALFNTNRYIVLEREQLNEVLKEQDLAAEGRIKKGTEAPVGEIYGADLIITAAVTEFTGDTKGLKGETKVLGVNVGGGVGKAHMALDIRIIDAKTSQIVASASVEGSASNVGLSGQGDVGPLPVSLSGFSNTPVEKAIRVCIQKATEYVVSKTPKEYYRR
jgi:curli biogenesis system outer membrane secretion channel CsgG